jgi:hypothetical protein
MRLKKIFIFLAVLISTVNSWGQLAAFQDDEDIIIPTFRYDIVRAKKVASLIIHYQYKPDGARIIDDGVVKYYRFDEEGKLVESYYTIKENYNSWDTIRSLYYYDKGGNLTIKRTIQGAFMDTWYYSWYENGSMKKRAHVHEVPLPGNADFKIASQTVISADSFAYSSYPKQLQRYGFNEEKTIYEKTVTQYDDNKRMISRYCHYSVGWIYSQVDLKYDASGRVSEYTLTGNLSGETHRSVTIVYDSTGNMASQKLFNDTKETDDVEYMYDNSTGLISNQLDRDYTKAVINIASFNYEFR